jgi:hypothetical protein
MIAIVMSIDLLFHTCNRVLLPSTKQPNLVCDDGVDYMMGLLFVFGFKFWIVVLELFPLLLMKSTHLIYLWLHCEAEMKKIEGQTC